MKRKYYNTYYIYDTKDNDKLVYKTEFIKDLCDKFELKSNSISSSISRNYLLKRRYRIVKKTNEFIQEVVVAYDMEDNERLVHMTNSTREMSEYFGVPIATIQSAIYQKGLLGRRYLIEKEFLEA